MIRTVAAICLAFMATALPASAQQNDAYRIGENDVLSIRVYEWMAIDGLVREWPSISGEYAVGPDGAVSLPFLGKYPVQDRTSEEIAVDIGEQLKQLLALQDRPTAAVEVLRYRPVFMSGYVESPGQYEYQPGTTVRMMLATAGGLERGPENDLGLSRAVISTRGQLRLLEDSYLRNAVRLARIEAELAGSDEIATFLDVEKTPKVDVLLTDEASILQTRKNRVERELSAIDRRKQILTTEIDSLEQKLIAQERQLEIAQLDLEQTKDLAGRGLATQANVFDRERFVVDRESTILDISLSLLEARLDLERTERDADALVDERRAELALERQRLEAEIAELTERRAIEGALLAETLAVSTQQAAEIAEAEEIVVNYFLIRMVDGVIREAKVDLDTVLKPGDVIEVRPAAPVIQ